MCGFLPNAFQAWAVLNRGFASSIRRDQTLVRMPEGWLLASLVGVALSLAISLSKTARDYLQPMLEFLRPLPASTIFPVAIAIFGLSPTMALFVVAFDSL